jgi:glutamate/tyrosine decarboxylase-like PLP-dependent enzyme
MRRRLDRLKALSQGLEPGPKQRRQWRDRIIAHTEEFLGRVPSSPAFRKVARPGARILSARFSEEPENAARILKLFADQVQKPGVRLGSPGYLGFIPISSLYPAALGDYLAAVVNPFAGNFFASPGAVRLELALTRWMARFVGYPKTAAGDLTSGGSISNLTTIVCAREARGLKPRDYERAVVYLTSQTHHSVGKALRIGGLGGCIRREIPLDQAYRMDARELELGVRKDRKQGLLPWLIVAAAGSTDTGAVDPLEDIAHLAKKAGLWLHVDGAYGAMFALCAPGKRVLRGMERSDSLTLDPHKGLFMPCGSGAVLVRDVRHLVEPYRYQAHYMQDRDTLAASDELSPSELSPELTRPFRGLRLWLSLKLIGVRAFRAALEEKLLLAQYFYQQVQGIDGIEVGPSPQLSVVVFRFIPKRGDADAYNLRVLKSIQRDGRIFISSTSLSSRVWLRLAVLCAATHREQIELALEILRSHANHR